MGKIFTEEEVAKRYDVGVRAVQGWRYDNIGPQFIRIGRAPVRYREEDLEAYEKSRTKGGEVPDRAKKVMARALSTLAMVSKWKMQDNAKEVIENVSTELRAMIEEKRGGQ